MANYHVYQCDRCLRTEENATSLPQYWATITVLDTNRSSSNDGAEYKRDVCPRCMDIIRSSIAVVPRKLEAVS